MQLSEIVAVPTPSQRRADGSKIAHLAGLLARVPPELIPIVVPFLSGSLRQGRIGVGGALLTAVRDVPPAASPSLGVRDVDAAFDRIAAAAGGQRAGPLRHLLGLATRDEQDFLGRLLFGELRQGALEGVLVEAIARAGGVDAARVRRDAMLAGDIAPVAQALLGDRDHSLSRFVLQPFQPVQPMLADSATDVAEALAIAGEARRGAEAPGVSFEHKHDGARIQVHKVGDDVRVYSRNLRDVTPAVPEIVAVTRAMPAHALVLDGEAIAMRADGRPQPFQITMRRFGRRLDVERLQQELPITPFFFDALYLDGDPLIDEPLGRRIGVLDAHVTAANRVARVVTASPEPIAILSVTRPPDHASRLGRVPPSRAIAATPWGSDADPPPIRSLRYTGAGGGMGGASMGS
jgi:DNA ligase-1